jgi:hypothetical protein
VEVCGKLSMGAYCGYTIEGPSREMHEAEWDEIGRVSMSFEAFGEVKKFILEACERSKKCDLKKTEERFAHIESVL